MAYSPIDKPNTNFNPVLYTGNGTTQSITGVNFQPDFTWIKDRDSTAVHYLFNAVSGATKFTNSDQTYGEQTNTQSLKSFDTDGFTLGTMTGANNNTNNFVSWNWKAGGTASSNTDGTISSTVSANTTSGFSIVKYTGTGANATVGHGLNAVPKIVFYKNLVNGSENWFVYSSKVGATKYLQLNTTVAETTSAGYFNNTDPTSSLLNVGTANGTNQNTNSIIAYCFADVKGFSKFGSYTGNGSTDGTFIYTGFKPAFVICKASSTTGDWLTADIKRLPINVMNGSLAANLSNAESYFGGNNIDFLSNGFKLRTTGGVYNSSGATYIYMAFAENPLVASNYVPTTAR